jgi:hypothetical protein
MCRQVETDGDEASRREYATHSTEAVDHRDGDHEVDGADDAGPAREEAEHEPDADEQLRVNGDRRENFGIRELEFAQELDELVHALRARDVIPHAPDEEEADEEAQQQQGEVAEAPRGIEKGELPHRAQD